MPGDIDPWFTMHFAAKHLLTIKWKERKSAQNNNNNNNNNTKKEKQHSIVSDKMRETSSHIKLQCVMPFQIYICIYYIIVVIVKEYRLKFEVRVLQGTATYSFLVRIS